MKDGWNANGHTIPIKQFNHERKTVMKRILNIVLILALVLLPFTPMEVYADEGKQATLIGIGGGIALLLMLPFFLHVLGGGSDSLVPDDQEGDNRLAEQLEQLEPIENVVPQTNFTPTENANVHGAMYPVFEW